MQDKLRILFTIEVYPPELNGSGIATKRLAEGMAERGYEVGVVCSGDSFDMQKSVENGVTVYRLSSIPVFARKDYHFSPFARSAMGNIFADFDPDLLHIEDHFFVSTAANIEAERNKIKVIGTNHFHPDNILPHSNISRESMIYKMIERKFWDSFIKVFNSIDVITVPSNTAAKIIEYEGINKPIRVISNGLNLENFNININTSKIYEKFNIKKNYPVLTTVSRLEKEKRVDLLIKALAEIKSLSDFQFLVIGRGKEKNNLELLAESAGIKDRIIFTGKLSEKELVGIYKISDIYLSGSEVELQGLSIMEAMATGLPIIASRAMAVPELVLHGTNGFLFRPGDKKDASDKILKILNDKKLQKKMSVNSLELIKKHDFEITLDKFEQIYIEAAKNLDKISV